jgi:hypothetical protein
MGRRESFHDRFVNFKKDPTSLLTCNDALYLKTDTTPSPTSPPPNGIYEGDAALGWFQGNISSYPTASASKELSFDNVDFRHQVYTEQVNISAFNDGDKNTAILDSDGTLCGYQVVDSANPAKKLADVHPISLNNLELNAAAATQAGRSMSARQLADKTRKSKDERPQICRRVRLARSSLRHCSRKIQNFLTVNGMISESRLLRIPLNLAVHFCSTPP